MKGNRGFTLLELLMVVIIIAILASIALPQYFRAAERSRASEALQILGTIRGAELRYKSLNPTNVFTTVLSDLDVSVPGDGTMPASPLWGYTVDGSAPGSHAVATRTSSNPATNGTTISLNLDGGASCESDAGSMYGLASGAC